MLVPEEILTHHATRPGEPARDIMRSELVYFETPNGGAVFSVGSISFCGSLPHNGFDNNISRMIGQRSAPLPQRVALGVSCLRRGGARRALPRAAISLRRGSAAG